MSKNSKTFKAVVGISFALIFALSSTAGAAITSFLKPGSSNSQVKELQQFLNGCSAETMVASTGAGSPGKETSYFGPATTAAVKAFQTKMGLVADALVGAKTRAAITAGCGGSTNNGGGLPVGCTSTIGYSPINGQKCDGGSSTTGGAVSMDASTPSANTILIATQSGANLLNMKFTGNYTVTNVKLMRTGISTNSALSNIYLFDGNTRLTDAASVNSAGEITFNQPSGLFMVNGSRVVSVRADIASSTAGQTVGVSFVSAMAGTETLSGSAAGYNYGIATNPSSMSSYSFGTVTPSGATLNVGPNVTLWQSTATISNNDTYLDRIAFRQIGSAPASSFANFKLFINGVQIASAAGLDSNGYVTFVPASPVLVQAGSRIMRVDADIVSGASRTVQLSLRTAADIGIRDSQLGVYVSASSGVPATASSASTIAGSTGGTLTIEKDISSPSTTLVLNGTDVSLGIFKATAYGEPVKIETLTVGGTFDGTQGSTNDAAVTLRNGRVLIGGAQYGSTATIVPAGTSYTINTTVYPGTPVMIEVRGDVYDNDGTGALDAADTILTTLIAGSSNGQKVDSLGTLNVPTANVSANTLTIASTALTLAKNLTYANPTVVLPQTAYKIGSWNLSGSSVEDVLLSTLSLDVDEVTVSADDFNESDMSYLYAVITVDGQTVVSTSPVASVSATDNNVSVSYTLAKGKSAVIEFFANLGSSVTAAEKVKTDLTVSGTSMQSGQSITATSADTDGQTLTAGSGSLTVTADAGTPDSTKFADNQTVRSASFKFAAVNSGYKVTDVVLTIPAAGATVVQTVNISSTTGSFSASMPGGTTVTFSGLNWNIPANQNAVLNVDLVLGTVAGVGGGTSGASLLTTLTSATATSASTGTSAAATESDPAGNVHYVYAAVPSITKQALPSTVLTNGTVTLARFTVNTNGTGTIAWKEVLIDIAKPGGGTDTDGTTPTITSPTLWDADTGTQITAAVAFQNANGTSASTCAESDSTCELLVTVGAKSDDNVEKQISGSKTYEIRATVGGTLATGDYITAMIARNLSYAANAVFTSADNDTTADDASFVWSDVSAQSHDTGTADWTNEALIMGLPTSTWSLTK